MEFIDLVKRFRDYKFSDPIYATENGYHEFDSELLDLSKESFFIKNDQAKQLLFLSEKIDLDSLDFENKIDLDLIKLSLKNDIFDLELRYNSYYDFEQKPIIGDKIVNSFLYLFLKDPRDSKIRLNAILSRFEKLPEMINSYKKTLECVVRRWKEMEIEQLNEVFDLFDNIYGWANSENFYYIRNLEIAIKKSKEAVKYYISHFNKLEVIENFHIGEDNAKEKLKLVGIDIGISDIINITKNFFIENENKINVLINNLRLKYNLSQDLSSSEIIDFIKEKFTLPLNEILDRYKFEQDRIMEFNEKTNYFILPENERLIIMQTPKYLVPTIPAGANFPPAPFEQGSKTSVVYLTIDEDRRKDQNFLMIKNIMIHEGIPGHHLQFSLAYENKSIVRKLLNYDILSEGWATYLETFMADIGYIEKEIVDEYLLIALSDFARLGARVAIDLYFMTGDDKYLGVVEGFKPEGSDVFSKAKSILKEVTGFSDARCEGELNWYSKERGYPICYLVGNYMTNKLKEEVLAKSENKVEATKRFHEIFLKEGLMPLHFIRKVFIEKGFIND